MRVRTANPCTAINGKLDAMSYQSAFAETLTEARDGSGYLFPYFSKNRETGSQT